MIELLAIHAAATTILCAVAAVHDPEVEPGELFTLALMWPFLAWCAGVYHMAAGFCWAAAKWRGYQCD